MYDHWPENREGWATYRLDAAMMDHTRTSALAQASGHLWACSKKHEQIRSGTPEKSRATDQRV
jgi:hypothetical protein